jgi:hypothetical protein
MIYKGDFYLVDGRNGTDMVPADLVDIDIPVGCEIRNDDPETADVFADAVAKLRDFVESPRGIQSIERHEGFYGRYSAPGYMDATDWSWGATEDEVREELDRMYGDNSEEAQ